MTAALKAMGFSISVMCGGNCSGVKGEHCSVDAAPGGYVMATALYGFIRSSGGVW